MKIKLKLKKEQLRKKLGIKDPLPPIPHAPPIPIDYIRIEDFVKSKIPTKEELEAILKPLIPILPELEKPKAEDIEGLDKFIRDRIPKGVVGGVTNLRIQQAFKYILKTEAPVGDINGVNLTYRLSQPIFAILSMSLNGEVIAQLPNYTIAGNTFTFSTALPVAYSGKDFECKYV